MGAVGPRRVALNDPSFNPPPPYKLEDNEHSIIDVTDLVMIDPVGTGLSHPIGKATNKDFWGVDQDIKSMSLFMTQYIKDNDRWNSPKYLLGESYGTTRSAGIVDYLEERTGIAMNGVILVSTVLTFNTLLFAADNDLPYIAFLTTYAAGAYYHNQLPKKRADLKQFIKEATSFAGGAYKDALFTAGALPAEVRKEILSRLHHLTGLSELYW